jgi:hypothetical protein
MDHAYVHSYKAAKLRKRGMLIFALGTASRSSTHRPDAARRHPTDLTGHAARVACVNQSDIPRRRRAAPLLPPRRSHSGRAAGRPAVGLDIRSFACKDRHPELGTVTAVCRSRRLPKPRASNGPLVRSPTAASMRSATACAVSARRSTMTTLSSPANPSAVLRPMAEPPPVTTAIRSVSFRFLSRCPVRWPSIQKPRGAVGVSRTDRQRAASSRTTS